MQYHHGLGLMRRPASVRFRQLSAQQPWNGPVDCAFSQGDVLFVGIAIVRWKAAYCLLYTTLVWPSMCHIDLFLHNSYHNTRRFKSRELKVKMFLCKLKRRRVWLNNLWHASPKWQAERFFWHAAFHAVHNFFISVARPVSLYCDETVYRCTHTHTHTHTHISDCVETVWIGVAKNRIASKHFYTNQEQCEVFTGYLSLRCRLGGDWANTWHWTKCFTIFFQTGSNSSPSYSHIFFFLASIEQTFIGNTITLCINYSVVIIVCINNKSALINNNCGRLKDLIEFFKIQWASESIYSKYLANLNMRPQNTLTYEKWRSRSMNCQMEVSDELHRYVN
jgi:hypothetical protein